MPVLAAYSSSLAGVPVIDPRCLKLRLLSFLYQIHVTVWASESSLVHRRPRLPARRRAPGAGLGNGVDPASWDGTRVESLFGATVARYYIH